MIKKDDHPTHPWICDIRGQGVHYHRRFATQNKARAFERQIHGSRQGSNQGTTTASSGAQTFEEFVRARIAEESASSTLRPSTVAGWESKLKNMPKWLRCKQLHRITVRDCVRYLQSLLT
ncbi:MAG TPA: hypothetical protein PKJ04_11105 [Nitrospira sp.]|nr:hypothetical protein [Nitrospira sp.]